jgi:hypothetical protein
VNYHKLKNGKSITVAEPVSMPTAPMETEEVVGNVGVAESTV